jgi:hypothetical protein
LGRLAFSGDVFCNYIALAVNRPVDGRLCPNFINAGTGLLHQEKGGNKKHQKNF